MQDEENQFYDTDVHNFIVNKHIKSILFTYLFLLLYVKALWETAK